MPTECEHPGIVPIDELGADRAGIRSIELLDHQPQGVGVHGDVVVADEEQAVFAFDQTEHLVGDRAESRIAGGRSDEGVGQARRDARLDGGERAVGRSAGHIAIRIAGRIVDDEEQEPQVRVVLAGERLDRVLEPRFGLVHHDDGNDGRRLRGLPLRSRGRMLGCTDVHGLRFHD